MSGLPFPQVTGDNAKNLRGRSLTGCNLRGIRPDRRSPRSLLVTIAFLAAACDGRPPSLYGDVGGAPAAPLPPLAISCGESIDVGVPIDGRPSWPERLALYAAGRARVEPGRTGWPEFAPVPPLYFHDELAQAARAHSMDMRETPCFQHESCDGTPFADRLKKYLTGPFMTLGENLAAGVNDGIQVIESSWINEVGAPPGEKGHRENMFNARYNYVGFGYLEGGTRFRGYWTQDLMGASPPSPPPPIAAGSHFVSDGGTTFGAVFFEPGGVSPESVEVVVDGRAVPLSLTRGAAAAGAYEAALPVDQGCHRYRFRALVAGRASCYPARGSFGVGGADCVEYQE